MVQKQPLTSKSTAYYVVCYYVLFSIWQCDTYGAATISPSPRAVVCRVGDQLEVTCSVNNSVLSWEVVLRGTIDRTERSVTTTLQIQQVVNMYSTVFVFSRTSQLGALPLESTLEISSVGQSLNDSTITCLESPSTVATTTVHIVGENDAYRPNQPKVSLEEQYGSGSITVFLQWTEELNNSLVTYHVSVEPMAHVITGNGRANLMLSYNTRYNVSVVADVCGRINATTSFMANYVNCGPPGLNESAGSVLVMGDTNVALAFEGDNVTFSCSSGLVLAGPYMSTCTGNGNWEPDPTEVACIDSTDCGPPPPARNGHIVRYSSTLEGEEVMYVCWNIQQEENSSQCVEIHTTAICNAKGKWEPRSDDMCAIFSERSFEASLSQEGKIAVASSVTVFVLTSILFFIIGFLSGRLCHKERKQVETVSPPTEEIHAPHYDVVLKHHIEQELELKNNVAYVPVQL